MSAPIPASNSSLSDRTLTPHPSCCSGMKLARSQGGQVRQNWTEPADYSAQNKIATLSVSPKLLTSELLEPQHAKTLCFCCMGPSSRTVLCISCCEKAAKYLDWKAGKLSGASPKATNQIRLRAKEKREKERAP
eukprot:s62_g22.t1